MQTNENNVNKIWALLQTTGGKDGPNTILWTFFAARTTAYSS
jgi:hypothetical protein